MHIHIHTHARTKRVNQLQVFPSFLIENFDFNNIKDKLLETHLVFYKIKENKIKNVLNQTLCSWSELFRLTSITGT